MGKKKKNTQKPTRVRGEALPFELRAPRWCVYLCLAVSVACAVGLICMWGNRKAFVQMVEDGDIVGWTLLVSLIMAAGLVGLYVSLYEKMTYADGVYAYYKPFKRNQFASVLDIKLAELITVEVWGNRGISTHYKVFFYGENDEILLNFFDDGTFFNNELFKESLRNNGIKCRNKKIEKYK